MLMSCRSTGGNITFASQGEGGMYGNKVLPRPSYLPSSANRSWIDLDNPLSDGVIERFYIYVHNVTALDPQSRRIQLQVWRQVDITLKTFRLVWLQRIQVSDLGALYSVCVWLSASTLNAVNILKAEPLSRK